MDSYVTSLLESQLPFGPWIAALAWAALFVANHRVLRSLRAANDAQRSIEAENWSVLRRSSEPKHIVAQVMVAGVGFLFGFILGGGGYVFFVGGLIVAIAYTLALNLQGLLSARALAQPNATTGTLTFSTGSALRYSAHRAVVGAFASFVVGLLLAHLALLGGAFFLASMAAGCLRRARNVPAQP